MLCIFIVRHFSMCSFQHVFGFTVCSCCTAEFTLLKLDVNRSLPPLNARYDDNGTFGFPSVFLSSV